MLTYLAFAAVAAAADVAGAAIVTRAHKHGHARLRYFVAGGAGFMLAAAFVRMLPESTHVPHAFLFVLLGYFGVHLFEHTVAPHFHFGEEVHQEALLRPSAGWLAVLGLGVHTVFDGVAIAAGFMVSPSLGAILFIAVMLHKLPEGFTIASIMLASGHSRGAALAAGTGLGVLTLAGALGTSLIAQHHVAYGARDRGAPGSPGALRALAGGVRGGRRPFRLRSWGAISGPPKWSDAILIRPCPGPRSSSTGST